MTGLERVMRRALEEVFAGDMSAEAGCVIDALADMGWVLTAAPDAAIDAPRVREAPRGRTPSTGRLSG